MPLNLFQIVLGLLLMYLGYNIARRTASQQISLMGYVVLIIGLAFVASGIGIISIPQLPS